MTETSTTTAPQQWRKRPVTVEAVQLTDDPAASDPGWDAIAMWCGGRLRNREIAVSGEYETELVISTLEGDMVAREGDWVIRGVVGEFYPCKPEIFKATYEPAEAPSTVTVTVVTAAGRETWTADRREGIRNIAYSDGALFVGVDEEGKTRLVPVAIYAPGQWTSVGVDERRAASGPDHSARAAGLEAELRAVLDIATGRIGPDALAAIVARVSRALELPGAGR